jgi:hypothetical protein
MTTQQEPNMNPRRGIVMVVVLVCLAVAMTMGALLLKTAALGRRAADAQRRSVQAQWLAESGLERAVARLAADGQYQGETWTIPPQALAEGGLVRIAVETPPGRAARRLVRVEAEYPNDPQFHCRCDKQAVVDLPEKKNIP